MLHGMRSLGPAGSVKYTAAEVSTLLVLHGCRAGGCTGDVCKARLGGIHWFDPSRVDTALDGRDHEGYLSHEDIAQMLGLNESQIEWTN